MIYLKLFLAYLQIGLFSIGGGHASIPVAQSVVVDGQGWLTLEEFTAMITISEMTPGPFGLNSATYVGIKTAGVLGGVISTFAFLIPSFIICTALFLLVKKFRNGRAVNGLMTGIRPAVSGLISSAGVSITILALFGASTLSELKVGFNFNPIALFICAVAFIATGKTKINPVFIILLSGVLGVILYSIF
ncbi:MAG: chromate transporter [Clostridia bacterium]|nr:chromate transporter [Clostridia bacterium]